ncbi:MAG: thiamine-phosphate kinase [Pseudomonadota bacterium]
MKLRDIGEFGFIERVASLCGIRRHGVVKGIGDDCAVISTDDGSYLLVTTDLLVERIHFLLSSTPPEMLGAKSLAVNLSDIAACGGTPLDAWIGLAVPERVGVEWLDAFYEGMTDLARTWNVNLLGGDTSASMQDLMISVTVTGKVLPSELLLRNTARVGDLIVLTGRVGDSAAGLLLLSGAAAPGLSPEAREILVRAHLSPMPHIRAGRFLASSAACTAAIDVSDGLSSDLWHICRQSGLGAVVVEDRVPISEEIIAAASIADPLHLAMNGGEDYVLLATVNPDMAADLFKRAENAGISLWPIGRLTEGPHVILERRDGSSLPLTPSGWNHFSA